MAEPVVWWKTAVLGALQGLTEFLPVSSSGHLLAFKTILEFEEAPLAFDLALHVSTLVAVLIYFRRDLLALCTHQRRWRALTLVVIATAPGVVFGVILGDWRESVGPWWVVGGWSVSALYLLAARGRGGRLPYIDLPTWRAGAIGTAQAMAIFPGISRSGSTIVSGLWLGLEQDAACRFSFLLSIPIVAGACLKKGLELSAEQVARSGGWAGIALGMAVAFAVGLAAIHALLGFVRGGKIHRFGWYNLAAALSFAAFLILRAASPVR